MITIKVFGPTPPCAKCKRAEAQAQEAAQRFPGQVELLKLDALGAEAEEYGIISTPMIVVDGEVIGSGKVVPADEIASIIQSKLGG